MLKTNISNYIIEKIMFQRNSNDILYFIIFFNRKFNNIKFNYEIYNKEILIIIEIINHYHYYFKELNYKIIIYINHHNFL